MEMTPVNSSNIASVGYDMETATLRVEFLKGAIYDYYGVPSDLYEGLLYAGSKGGYHRQYIVKGGFSYTKV